LLTGTSTTSILHRPHFSPGGSRKRSKRSGGFSRPVYSLSRIGPFEPLGHTQFQRYTVAATLGFTAFFVQMLVRGWLVNELTNSPLQVSLVPVLLMAPMLVFTLVGGELSDRFKRPRVIMITSSVIALTYVAATVLLLTDLVQSWHLLLLTGIHGIAGALEGPSRQSLVGDLVRPRLQRVAIGLSPAIFNVAQIIGPLIGGVILASAGADAAAVVSVVLLVISIPIYARLKPVAKSRIGGHAPFLRSVRDGARYVFGHPELRWYLLAGFVLVITANTWGALFPPLAKEVLGRGAGGLATLQVAVGIGALAGAVVTVPLGARYGEKKLEVISGFAFAASLGALAASQIFILSVVIVALGAAFATFYFVTNMIAMQMTADPEYRSRVISVRFIMFGFSPFGMIALGVLAEYFGTQVAMGVIAGTAAVLLAGVTLLFRAASPARMEAGPAVDGDSTAPQSSLAGPAPR
jgi:MFS family permease